jgi:hypothetical protein
MGYESVENGVSCGAFTLRFTKALRAATTDLDGDRRISVFEAAARAGESLLTQFQQSPVVAGKPWDFALFASGPKTSQRAKPELNALLVGAGEYSSPHLPPLPGPPNDVARWQETLKPSKAALFRKGQVRTLLGKRATGDGIRAALEACANKNSDSDLFLFFFSGRALLNWTDQEGADRSRKQCDLVAYDWDGRGKGVVPLSEVVRFVNDIPAAARIIVVDA